MPVCNQSISSRNLTSWNLFGILLNFHSLRIDDFTIRHGNEGIVGTFLIVSILSWTISWNIWLLTWKQINWSNWLTVLALDFELLCLDIGLRCGNYDSIHHEWFWNHGTVDVSQSTSTFITFHNNLPFTLSIIVREFFWSFFHIGFDCFIHHSQHFQRMRHIFLI